MVSLPSCCRPRCAVWTTTVLVGMLCGCLGWGPSSVAQIVIRPGRVVHVQESVEDDLAGVYLPSDRTRARAMARAQRRLQEGEYHETLDFLNQVLGGDEDAFLDSSAEASQLLGLKATARHLIAGLPAEGRQAYQLLYGARARRHLENALAKGDREAMARVVRQYFYTPAGMEAALVLAQMEFDRGHPLAAARLYQELLDTPEAAERFDPQLTILAALSWAAAGELERTDPLLRSLAEQFAGTEIDVAGHRVQVPTPGDDLTEWFSEAIGRPQLANPTDQDWITRRGNPARNTEQPGGPPLLRPRWEARVVNDPRLESLLSDHSSRITDQDIVAVPAARPVAVGDVVLMRTPSNVVALDWQTGKRIWETRDDLDEEQEQFVSEFSVGAREDKWPQERSPLEQRLWEDVLAMSLSSDGQRVFVLGDVSLLSIDDPGRFGRMPVFGGRVNPAGMTNRLSAYDLATEGKLVWELDGSDMMGEFAGAFFLGPPLAVHDSLFVVAELRGALTLLVLEPRTGELQWRQQLVNLEQGIAVDPLRRLTGASPSYADGILVCPTTAGVIVAVDVENRQFAWAYRYPFHARSPMDLQNVWQQRVQRQQPEQNDRWLDGDVVLADGRVYVTPPESAELHCLDLQTGQLHWKRMRDDFLYIGCIDQGRVLLVGSKALQLLRAEDGTPITSDEQLALPSGAMPAGYGYLSNGRYYLPLTTGEIIAVDVAGGGLSDAVPMHPDVSLGNLISHRGTVISQSALVLDRFEQIDLLRERVAAALDRNPDDSTALRELAEMKRVDGDLPESVRLLKRAFRLTPDDPLTREMLAETLLDLLATDYASHREDLPLLSSLITGQQLQVNLQRIKALGLQKLGKRWEAFEAYLSMTDLTDEEGSSVRVDPHYVVRSDRWIRGQLNNLWSQASASERQAIADALASRRKSWGESPSVAQLRHYLAHFDGLPNCDDVRVQLVRELVTGQNFQEAELELLRLEHASAEQSQAAAAVLMTKLLLDSNRREEAEPYAAALGGPWSDVVALDGMKGRQWIEELGLREASGRVGSRRDWPRGQVSGELLPTSTAPRSAAARRAQADRQAFLRRLRLEQVYPASLETPQWFITNDGRRLVGRNPWGEDIFRFDFRRDNQWRRFQLNSNLVQAAQLGHLLFLSLGSQVVAFDTRRVGGDKDLWRTYPASQTSAPSTRSTNRRSPTVYHPSSGRRRAFGPNGTPFGGIGPVTPQGVVLQQHGQLRCVDPVTGEVLWDRDDVSAGSELFGDDQLTFAADVERGVAQVYSTIDGALLDERPLPDFPWMLTAGRNVAQLDYHGGSRMTVRVVDVWSETTLLEADYDPGSRFSVVEPQFLLVLEQSGKFQCIDVRAGKVIVDQQLEIAGKPRSVHAMLSQDELFLTVDTEAIQNHRSIGPDYPLVTGQVYAFDMQTGAALWPGPATVRQRGITLSQPENIPLLVLVDREERRDASAGGSSHLRLLCLDKRTGQSVFRDDDLPDTAGGHFRILAERGAAPTVTIEMSTRTVRLSLSDRPRPPEPPANDAVEAARKSLGRGLWDVGRKMGDVIQEAWQNPGGTIWPVPASNPLQAPLQGQADSDDEQEQDDD